MKVLVLSDLNWNSESRRINREDILLLYESRSLGHGLRFSRAAAYLNVIELEQPDLVIFAGDVTGDGSCGHGFHTAFFYLLSVLEIKRLPTLYIKGDNDLDEYYNSVLKNSSHFSYVKEISDQSVSVGGLRVLGVSYDTTADKPTLKAFINEHKANTYDLVVCHSPLKRRTGLFALNCRLLITGHFDNKIFSIGGKVFVSLSNDSSLINYGTYTRKKSSEVFQYRFKHFQKRLSLSYTLDSEGTDQLLIDDIPIDIKQYEKLQLPKSNYDKEKNALSLSLKFLRGAAYKKGLRQMWEIKKGKVIPEKSALKALMKLQITSRHKVSRTMLADYLGKEVWKYIK